MPAGRPKGSPNKPRIWAEAIDKALKQSEDGKPAKIRALAEKLLTMALAGDMQAMRELGDRVDGKALASVEISGELNVTAMTDEQLAARLRELTGDDASS